MKEVKKESGCAGPQTPTEVKFQNHFNTAYPEKQVLGKDVVAAIKEKYPGFDHSLWSKCKRPDLYGVSLTAGARKCVDELKPRKKASRTKEERWGCRVSKATHSRLQTAMAARGITSKQTFIEAIILKWLEENEHEVHKSEAKSV